MTTMTLEALQAQLAEANAKIARMQQANQRKLTLKVSQAGAVSLYGMGRWPVTLYKGQWLKVLDQADAIRQFIVDNDANLATKD